MRYQLLLIGLGGALGTILRYLMQLFIRKHWVTVFPSGTFLVNVIGCLFIGILYGISTKYSNISEAWRLFLIVGICGGYTTFSSYSYESVELLRNGNYTYFFAYAVLSVVIGLSATILGMIITR